MATTTNYGWTTPNDTDLVKDGAAAIRTLGSSIDTTTKNLNPETTLGDIAYRSASANTNTRLPIGSNGQILGVSAGVPAWINNDQGDITEVQAGVGISVASGTGPIPIITNSSTDLITTAGDLLYGTAADTVARLGIGTAGQVLKVNAGATAPEWGAASSTPTFKGVYTYIASDQTLSNNTSTAINYDTELFDTDAFHNNATNKDRITIPAGLGGYYLIVVGAQWNSNSSGYRQITIQKNATSNVMIFDYPGLSVSNSYIGKSTIFNLTAGDYINAVGYQNSGGNLALGGGSVATFFSVQYLGV